LLRSSLALVEEGTMGAHWHFAHGMLREAVLAPAREAGRLPNLHRACAFALANDPNWVDRYGRHLLAAGETDAAIDALIEGAVTAAHTGLFSRAVHAASLAEQAIPASDPRSRRALEVRIHAARLRGETEEAQVHIRRLLQWAKLRRDAAAQTTALSARADLLLRTGAIEEAIEVARSAVESSVDLSGRQQAEAHSGLATAHAKAWSFRNAEAAFREAAGHDNHFYPAAYGLGRIRLDLEHAHAALPFIERAVQLAAEDGDSISVALYGCTLSQTQRFLGNLDKSAALAEASIRSLASCGADGASEARIQLALTFLQQGLARKARDLMEEELSLTAHRDDHAVVRLGKAVLWAACCATDEWERVAELTPIDGDGPSVSRATEMELVRLLHRSGERAFHANQPVFARDAWTPARVVYRRLGMTQESAQLTHVLRGLPSTSVRLNPQSDTSGVSRRLVRRRDRDD
jgi:tetratricopeptide (TPR) repeat protein